MVMCSIKFVTASLILLSISYSSYSKEKIVRQVAIENDTFNIDSTANFIMEKQLKVHKELFMRISGIWKDIHKIDAHEAKARDDIKKPISCKKKNNSMEYTSLSRFGINKITIFENGLINTIDFKADKPRRMSLAERKEYDSTQQYPETFRALSESEAIGLARVFIDRIYGTGRASNYDSVLVRTINEVYHLMFNIKTKNDIRGVGRISIEICVNTGQIRRFSGSRYPLLTEADYSYVPKISKEQALQMYREECAKINADIEIREMFLIKEVPRRRGGEKIWMWKIFGKRKDKEKLMASMLFIDSETGEILTNALK